MKTFVATIQVEINAEDENDAHDAMHAIFCEQLQQDSLINEWQYLPMGTYWTGVVEASLPRDENDHDRHP